MLDKAKIKPEANIAATCAAQGLNRQQVYSEKERFNKILTEAPSPNRGRPRQGACSDHKDAREKLSYATDRLRISVLEYRLANPGAVVLHCERTTYNDAFKRFVLNSSDSFTGTDEVLRCTHNVSARSI